MLKKKKLPAKQKKKAAPPRVKGAIGRRFCYCTPSCGKLLVKRTIEDHVRKG